MAGTLQAPLHEAQVTRLLVDLNRSPHHRELFSLCSRTLDSSARERVLSLHYRRYRDALQARIAGAIRGGRRVLHVSVHSFTPVLHGEPRRADVDLLYDPRRKRETEVAQRWRAALRTSAPDLRVRRNYPYRGVADGLVPFLRRQFSADAYVGIELEMNQALVAQPGAGRRRIVRALLPALEASAALP